MANEPALYARMELRIKDFERQLQRAEARAEQGTARIGKSADRAGKQLEGRLSGMAGRLGAQIAGAFAVYAAVQAGRELTETATRIQNALRVAGLEGEALEGTYRQLFAAAQENAAPIESMVQLYSRLSLAQKELGVSSDDLIDFTSNVALALRVAGTDATQASGALLQLSQALGGSVVRAEEFNSMLEGAPTIVQAAAAGIEQAGGSVAKLRQLVTDGKVSSAAFFQGFQAGARLLEQRAAGSVSTISQEFIRLQNVLIDVAREFDEATGASQLAARLIRGIGDALQYVGDNADAFVSAASVVLNWIKSIGAAAQETAGQIASMLSAPGSAPLRITVNGNERRDPRAGSSRRGGATMAPPPAPISLDDFPVDGEGSKKGKSRLDSYERLTQMIRERTTAIEAETAAQAGLNPLVNDYGFAVEKARAAHDLLTAAQEAGIAITPELEAQIDTLATAYANASVTSAQLAASQDRVRQAAQDFNDLGRDALGGFISDLRNGVSAADALANALDRVIDRLLDGALDALFAPSSGGSLISALFGGLAKGGPVSGSGGIGHAATGGSIRGRGTGTSDSIPMMLSNGEFVVNARQAAKFGPLLDAINTGRIGHMATGGFVAPRFPSPASLGVAARGAQAGMTVTYAPQVSIAAGASPESVAELRRVMEEDRRSFAQRTVRVIRDAQRRNVGI